MFGSAYSKAPSAEKVKYGCVNTSGDVGGVAVAHAYGDCYLLLKTSVRSRTTFCNADSGGFNAGTHRIGTCEHYAHVMELYADAELKAVLDVGSGKKRHRTSSKGTASYKEIQIHGPVALAEHVEALVSASLCVTFCACASNI